LEIPSSSYCSLGVKQQSLTSLLLLIYQTLFLVVFEYFYDVYLFEIKHVCKSTGQSGQVNVKDLQTTLDAM
jgi:hypothetical protein